MNKRLVLLLGAIISGCAAQQPTPEAPSVSVYNSCNSRIIPHTALQTAHTIIADSPYSTPSKPAGVVLADSLYNACAPLSAITITSSNAGTAGPYWIMLFHQGNYVQLATKDAHNYTGIDHQKTTDRMVVVYYRWKLPGDTEAGQRGYARVRYIWDKDHIKQLDPTPEHL